MKVLAKTSDKGLIVEISPEEQKVLNRLNYQVFSGFFPGLWSSGRDGVDFAPALLAVESYVNDCNLSNRLNYLARQQENSES